MTAPSSRCPTPEVIAAFIAGNVFGEELKMTTDHLRECEDCREVAAEAAVENRRGLHVVEEPRPRQLSPWWLRIAAAALAGVILGLWAFRSDHDNDAIRPLVEAAPREERWVEPRLTGGFPWARLGGTRRGDSPDPSQMKVVGAAGEVLEQTKGKSSVEARHAAAVAHLLSGHPRNAVEVLAPVADRAQSANVWNDLAASRYAASVRHDDPAQLTEALAAVDAALRREPELPEALFNRALILERLGLTKQARVAWERYLSVDGDSPWSAEARQHLESLKPISSFRDELQRRYAALARNPEEVDAIVHEYPQDCRVWAETEILGNWGEAVQRGDASSAATHLRVAQSIARKLSDRGEPMLSTIVDAISAADVTRRLTLAEGHAKFREARILYGSNHPVAAEPIFLAAAAKFHAAGSPMALLARYFAANTIYDQGRTEEARFLLEELLHAAPSRFIAYRAQLLWQLGLAYAAGGRWGTAIDAFGKSVAGFETLSEAGYANAVRNILAEAYDQVGDQRAAWRLRIRSLRDIGRASERESRVALEAAARAAAVNRDWQVGISILGLLIDTDRPQYDLVYVESLLSRARMQARLGETNAAAADLMDATEAIARLADPSIRRRAEADRMIVAAFLASTPAEALPMLTRAIRFHEGPGRRMHLPELHLQRGRIQLTTGNAAAAEDDFDHGIAEVERQRSSIGSPNEAWSNFAVAEELYDEAIDLAVTRGDTAKAFTYAERSRLRDGDRAPEALPRIVDTALVEYAALRKRLVIFVRDAHGLRAIPVNVGREVLLERVEQLTQSAMAENMMAFRTTSAALYRDLINPIAEAVATSKMLVFIPDATLSAVPFSALIDGGGRYLIEERAVLVAPSSALLARLHREPTASRAQRLLLVRGAATREGDPSGLSAIDREMTAIAAEYGASTEVVPIGLDPADFERHAAGADVIHFSGHADFPDGVAKAALVTSRRSGAGRLEADEIAAMKLSKTRTVVLAACGTGLGRQRPGRMDISVARAFLAAGVPSVVATLWPIDDRPAADFFPAFHRHLSRGRSPAEALRATQLEWIRRPHSSPGMWAAVQVLGS